ncbi:MAG: metallophosphoesterase [Deltaproteobacteria bacterium]|nr:metallophosphoesterase [Deltaproteobacteria bacterium]
MAKQSFKIAHLSDLHLTKTDGASRSEQKLFNKLKGMNAAFRKIVVLKPIQKADLILVTGDVTDRGDIESWNVFWDTINDAGLKDRTHVIPGNHDVCCLGARLPGKRKAYKDADLQKAVKGLRIGGKPTKFPWVINPDPRVVIFGLNSNNLGNLNAVTNAMGELDYYQLSSLASKLHVYRDVPVKIVALHHSPNIPGAETARKRGQKPYSKLERLGHQISEGQRNALQLLCIAHRVRLLIHGHLHMAEDRRLGGIRIIGAMASTQPTTKRKQNNNYQFYTYSVLGDGGRVRSELRSITV